MNFQSFTKQIGDYLSGSSRSSKSKRSTHLASEHSCSNTVKEFPSDSISMALNESKYASNEPSHIEPTKSKPPKTEEQNLKDQELREAIDKANTGFRLTEKQQSLLQAESDAYAKELMRENLGDDRRNALYAGGKDGEMTDAQRRIKAEGQQVMRLAPPPDIKAKPLWEPIPAFPQTTSAMFLSKLSSDTLKMSCKQYLDHLLNGCANGAGKNDPALVALEKNLKTNSVNNGSSLIDMIDLNERKLQVGSQSVSYGISEPTIANNASQDLFGLDFGIEVKSSVDNGNQEEAIYTTPHLAAAAQAAQRTETEGLIASLQSFSLGLNDKKLPAKTLPITNAVEVDERPDDSEFATPPASPEKKSSTRPVTSSVLNNSIAPEKKPSTLSAGLAKYFVAAKTSIPISNPPPAEITKRITLLSKSEATNGRPAPFTESDDRPSDSEFETPPRSPAKAKKHNGTAPIASASALLQEKPYNKPVLSTLSHQDSVPTETASVKLKDAYNVANGQDVAMKPAVSKGRIETDSAPKIAPQNQTFNSVQTAASSILPPSKPKGVIEASAPSAISYQQEVTRGPVLETAKAPITPTLAAAKQTVGPTLGMSKYAPGNRPKDAPMSPPPTSKVSPATDGRIVKSYADLSPTKENPALMEPTSQIFRTRGFGATTFTMQPYVGMSSPASPDYSNSGGVSLGMASPIPRKATREATISAPATQLPPLAPSQYNGLASPTFNFSTPIVASATSSSFNPSCPAFETSTHSRPASISAQLISPSLSYPRNPNPNPVLSTATNTPSFNASNYAPTAETAPASPAHATTGNDNTLKENIAFGSKLYGHTVPPKRPGEKREANAGMRASKYAS